MDLFDLIESTDNVCNDTSIILSKQTASPKEIQQTIELLENSIHKLESIILASPFHFALFDLEKNLGVMKANLKRFNYEKDHTEWIEVASIFKSRTFTGVLCNQLDLTLEHFLQLAAAAFEDKVRKLLKEESFLKINMDLSGVFINKHTGALCRLDTNYHPNGEADETDDLKKWFWDYVVDVFSPQLLKWKREGFCLDTVINIKLNANRKIDYPFLDTY